MSGIWTGRGTGPLRTVTRREATLLAVAVSVAALMTFAVFRVRPALDQIDSYGVRETEDRQELARLRTPTPPDEPVKDVKERVETREEQLRELDELFAELSGTFTPEDAVGGNADLQFRIAELARNSGAAVLESVPVTLRGLSSDSESSTRDPVLRGLVAGEPLTRPMRRVRLRSSFSGLCAFLAGLAKLPGRAIVVRFDLTIEQERNADGGPLMSDLVVTL